MTNITKLALTEGQTPITINSREVAEMVGKDHDKLLRDIRKYAKVLEDSPKLETPNFFIESTYINSQNKQQPCYLITKKGCDMVANKMTGEKGILFTAAYVTKFEAMEKELSMSKFSLPSTYVEALKFLVEAEEEKERLIASNNEKEEIIQLQIPKVELCNSFLDTENLYTVNNIAKTLAIKNLGRNKLYDWLRWNKILIDTNEAYQRFINSGYIVHRNSSYTVPVYDWKDGKKIKTGVESRSEMKVFFTAKGIEWLYKKLVKQEYKIDKTVDVVIDELNSLPE